MIKKTISQLALISLASSVVSSGELVTGNGAFEFTLNPQASDTSQIQPFGPTHGGIAVSKQTGTVYISTDSGKGIAVFNKEGAFQSFMTPEFTHLHSLHLLEKDGAEHLIAAQGRGDKSRGILFKLDGTLVQEVSSQSAGLPDGAFKGLTAATMDKAGNWYLACGYGSQNIYKLAPDGKHLLTFGGRGGPHENEKFSCCHGIRVDYRYGDTPYLIIADREHGMIKHFTLDGKFHAIHSKGLRRPCTFDFHGANLAVAELAGRATILDQGGIPVSFLGDNPTAAQRANFGVPPAEWHPEYFTAPHGISYTAEGNLWVQDWNVKGRIHFLKKK